MFHVLFSADVTIMLRPLAAVSPCLNLGQILPRFAWARVNQSENKFRVVTKMSVCNSRENSEGG